MQRALARAAWPAQVLSDHRPDATSGPNCRTGHHCRTDRTNLFLRDHASLFGKHTYYIKHWRQELSTTILQYTLNMIEYVHWIYTISVCLCRSLWKDVKGSSMTLTSVEAQAWCATIDQVSAGCKSLVLGTPANRCSLSNPTHDHSLPLHSLAYVIEPSSLLFHCLQRKGSSEMARAGACAATLATWRKEKSSSAKKRTLAI